jgi:TolB-like protein
MTVFLLAGGTAVAAPKLNQRLAVLEFSGRSMEADALGAFADAVRGGTVDGLVGRDVKVMTRENMMVLLREMGKSECAEGECEVETGRNIGAQFVISGSVVHIEGAYVVGLKLHETQQGDLLASETIQAKTQLAALGQLRQLGKEMVAKITGGSQSTTPALAPPSDNMPGPGGASLAAPDGQPNSQSGRGQGGSPAQRHGFLAMPYVGMQYQIHGATDIYDGKLFPRALRFGLLLGGIGGHMNENYSLSGEFGLATWKISWNHSNGDDRLYQADFNATALRHVRWSWGEFVAGPKLGWAILRGVDVLDSSGPLAGAKIGLLMAPAGWISLGLLADVNYVRLFSSNNILGSFAVAALF